MATIIEKIAQEAAELTKQERLTLVRLLLDFDQPDNSAEIANAWESEIRARVAAVDEGRVSGLPSEQIKKEMTNRFGRR
jgi:putative addiction module component (TIGR02574 family)